MAYYFMTEKKKGEYIPLDITQSKYFTKLSKYNKKGVFPLLIIANRKNLDILGKYILIKTR